MVHGVTRKVLRFCHSTHEVVCAQVSHDLHVLPHVSDNNLWYYFGFIDITQHYNYSKKLERAAKRILYCRDTSTMSACPPFEYARRFLLQMDAYIAPVLPNFESRIDDFLEHVNI